MGADKKRQMPGKVSICERLTGAMIGATMSVLNPFWLGFGDKLSENALVSGTIRAHPRPSA